MTEDTQKPKVTVSEMEANPEKWESFELYRGRPVKIAATTLRHASVVPQLAHSIETWIRGEQGRGSIYIGGTVVLGQESLYRYDLGWSPEPTPDKIDETRAMPIMIEVVDYGDPLPRMMVKIEDYLANGADQVWAVMLEPAGMIIFLPDGSGRIYRGHESYAPGDLMPGFTVDIGTLDPGRAGKSRAE